MGCRRGDDDVIDWSREFEEAAPATATEPAPSPAQTPSPAPAPHGDPIAAPAETRGE